MISEFEFIHNIKDKFGVKSIGDDCAVIPKDDKTDLLLTADLLVEAIDFRLEWTIPEFLGHKALAVSLSDIAAMGGTPKWSLLSIGVPDHLWKTDFLDRFYDGWFKLARKYCVDLIGGDISRSPDKLVIDSVVGGECPHGKALLRSTAKPGQAIFVSGTLGAAAAGLKQLENAVRYDESGDQFLVSRQLKPYPQVEIANLLQSLDIITAAIDISDGLSSDLRHLCRESRVGALIYQNRLPIHPAVIAIFPPEESFDLALNGGEDFELLLTADASHIAQLESIGLTQIGETDGTRDIKLVSDSGTVSLTPKGHRHF